MKSRNRLAKLRGAIIAIALLAAGLAIGWRRVPANAPPAPSPPEPVLHQRIARVDLDDTTVGRAIDSIHALCGFNLEVNWKQFADAGVTPATPMRIEVHLHDVTAEQILNKLLSYVVDANGRPVTVYIDEHPGGIISFGAAPARHAGSPEQDDAADALEPDPAHPYLETRVFDIASLCIDGGGWIKLTDAEEVPAGGQTFADLYPHTDAPTRADRLMAVVETAIDPDSWRETGGANGSIRHLSGSLIVTQTPDNLDAIGELLRLLRAAK